ncbi:MAG: glycosyltransferase family 39 protein [Verrucomicrobia bacterium]|nr:glycosyltransferase family 39 protein [Verrucomicrobiota bacterium]
MAPDPAALVPIDPQPPARPRRQAVLTALAAAALLVAYAVLATMASRRQGLSFDEGLQLAVGYNLWVHHDYRIEGANGDLIKRWATLPFLALQPKFVGRDDPLWLAGNAYELGRRFLFGLGNSPEQLLWVSRAMVTVIGVALGLLVFLVARRHFGAAGGLLSLTLFAFSPHMLAFGSLVSTDLAITATLFASTWCCWRLLHVVTVGRLLAGLVSAGLLVLAKPTALVILPIAAVLIAVRLWRGDALILRHGAREWRLRRRRLQTGVMALLVILHVLAGWGALWAHYGFRYEASPDPTDPRIAFFSAPSRDEIPAPLAATLGWLQAHRILPEGFIRGIETLLGCDDQLGSFAHGEWRLEGRYWFFPYAIWVKTHPALLLLLAAGVGSWWWRRRQLGAWAPGPGVYEATPWFALVGCYLAVAMSEDINLGHRHVLPIYPALQVLAGAAALLIRRAIVWSRPALAALAAWPAFDAVALHPHYLAYFGPQAGGPAAGYLRLVDSSLDWGTELPALKRWIDRHNPRGEVPMHLAYFGADSPAHHRIAARRLPGFLERRTFEPYPLSPGYYAISASLFQSVYTTAFGPWSRDYEELYQRLLRQVIALEEQVPDPVQRARLVKRPENCALASDIDLFDNLRFARLCAWLRQQGPPHHLVGYSILIWRLEYADLKEALLGPPAELTNRPPVIRRYRQFVVRTK